MARPYALELRERAVAAVIVEELSWEEAARRYAVGQATLARWLALWRGGQSLEPKAEAKPGPAPRLDEAMRARLKAQLAAAPDARLGDHARAWKRASGQTLSETTLWRALHGLGWTRKKSTSSTPGATRPNGRRGGRSTPG